MIIKSSRTLICSSNIHWSLWFRRWAWPSWYLVSGSTTTSSSSPPSWRSRRGSAEHPANCCYLHKYTYINRYREIYLHYICRYRYVTMIIDRKSGRIFFYQSKVIIIFYCTKFVPMRGSSIVLWLLAGGTEIKKYVEYIWAIRAENLHQ